MLVCVTESKLLSGPADENNTSSNSGMHPKIDSKKHMSEIKRSRHSNSSCNGSW